MYANRTFSHITHTDPKTKSKVFARLDTIQHFSLELNFVSVAWTRVPFSYISQTLWGERGLGALCLEKGCTSENLSAFSESYQCAHYLIILQHLEFLPANTAGSLWTARSTTLLRTMSAAPKELFHTDKMPQFPPALHFKYHLKLPHIERLRLSCHRAAGCKNCSRNSTPDLLSGMLLSENLG